MCVARDNYTEIALHRSVLIDTHRIQVHNHVSTDLTLLNVCKSVDGEVVARDAPAERVQGGDGEMGARDAND